MAQIIDCFPFFNELDVLEIRFNELYDVVDYFVLVESSHTHSGQEKSLHFVENAQRFEPFLHKLIYVNSKLDYVEGDWERENRQRNDIRDGLNNLELSDDDIVLISDCDEIPKKEVVDFAAGNIREFPIAFNHNFFAYYLNLRGINKEWCGTVATKAGWVKNQSPQFFRNNKDYFPRIKGDAGWHFSWLGGHEKVLTKLKSFAHQENPFKDLSVDELQKIFNERVIQNKQFCFDNDSNPLELLTIDDSYPEFVRNNQEQFAHLILNG